MLTLLSISALLTASAEAALLSNVQGDVTINRGDGFKPASGGAVVSPGDRIRVASGSADIVYENGCAVKVAGGQVVAVQYSGPSCGGSSGGGGGGLKDGVSETPVMLYVGGGLLLAGGAAAGVILLMPSKPASP